MAGKKVDRFLLLLVLATLSVAAAVASWTLAADRGTAVHRGMLDLSHWDPYKDGVFDLDGEWEFYPGELLTPDHSVQERGKGGFIQVPGEWNGWTGPDGAAMEGYGYGTYRLVVTNAPVGEALAIAKNYVRFADKLYIDGALVGESGEPGAARDSYVPRNVPYTAYFKVAHSEFEVLLQVSNFDFEAGGITNSLQFGPGKDVQVRKGLIVGVDLMGTMVWLIIAAFTLGMYLWFHRNALLLWFALYFVLYAISVIANGERVLLQWLPELPFELAFKIKTVSLFATPALFFLIVRKLIERPIVRGIVRAMVWLLTLYVAAIALLPFRLYSAAQDIVYLVMMLAYLALIGCLIREYAKGRYGRLSRRQFQLFIAAVWATIMLGANVILSNANMTSMLLNNAVGSLFFICVVTLLIHQYVAAYVSMDKLTKRLQIADRMKDEFLLLTSHELNTPLNGIMNVSRTLLQDTIRRGGTEARERLLMIRNTAYQMSNLVNDIIDGARIRDGKLALNPGLVDLGSCVSVVMEVSAFLAKGKNIRLVPRIDPQARYVHADERRLIQVIHNAVHSILTDTQVGDVSVVSSLSDGRVLIGIETSVPKAKTDENAAAADNGFTVGLSVAKELVELMGGSFVSGRNGLHLSLPAAPSDSLAEVAAAAEPETSPAPAGQGSRRDGAARILIASADPIGVEHLYGMLTAEGYEALFAGNGKEAYEAVTRFDRPDLVLVDVMLPEENGFELCRKIRRHFTQVELPLLLISSRSTSADIEAGIAAGASDFVARPLDPGEIRVRIHTLLSMKRLVKEAARSEMAFLRSQIKPHFLYNALGTIMSLCYTDGPRAGELLSIFSRYLRIIFHLDNTEETVRLSKEIELIQAYADIEKARFGERVRVELDIDSELYRCHVMPLTIEPLVENAIRHGVSKKLSGGTVKLSIQREGEFVRVVVEDDGVGMTAEQVEAILNREKQEQGVGFRNITRRVAHMTGRAPIVESERGVGTKVIIWLPLVYE